MASPVRVDRRAIRRVLPGCLAAILCGCSLAPVYHPPELDMPASFKGDDVWSPAAPADGAARGDWWRVYNDASLGELEARLDAANPNLDVALARYDQARAFESQTRSGLFPHMAVTASPTNNRQSNLRPLRGSDQPNEYDADTVGIVADYELDLWGRVRNEVAEGKAEAQAAQADLASVRLSLEAQLANQYIRLRGFDVQARILGDSIDAYRKALKLTQNRHAGGIASGLDVSRAKAQLSDAMAQASEVAAQRALTEHAIASLSGTPASTFALPSATTPIALPAIPREVPSLLLQRRPDIAAAERRTFAANAGIGIARAAFYPTISLSAAFGWQDTGHGTLLTAGNRYWAVGPLAALSVFDAGLRRAREREARAVFDEASARYRGVVLGAFQQVEDNLSLLDELGREAQNEDDATSAAKQSQAIATNRYREGAVNYLDVVTAQTAALQAERLAEAVRTRRLQASVDLIRALGGGWSTAPTGDVAVAAPP
jgi:multidrug efflux system outer membrane protein